MEFEWDSRKAEINIKKHKVSFDEAKSIFFDEFSLMIQDPDHSILEERFILLGFSDQSRELVVSHCERLGIDDSENEETRIRIISARKADKTERKLYWQKRSQ